MYRGMVAGAEASLDSVLRAFHGRVLGGTVNDADMPTLSNRVFSHLREEALQLSSAPFTKSMVRFRVRFSSWADAHSRSVDVAGCVDVSDQTDPRNARAQTPPRKSRLTVLVPH